jgi:hypothetical protein
MIERHVIEIRKEMNEKRLQDEEQRKQCVHYIPSIRITSVFFSANSHREYASAKFERTKAEQERTRKEEELQKLKEIALKEQQDLNEKRLHTLVDDFIRMKALTVRRKQIFR